jgi:hypothetical protein
LQRECALEISSFVRARGLSIKLNAYFGKHVLSSRKGEAILCVSTVFERNVRSSSETVSCNEDSLRRISCNL